MRCAFMKPTELEKADWVLAGLEAALREEIRKP